MMRSAQIELSSGGVICRRTSGGGLEVLLIRDSYGNWGFPKGHLEANETPEQAAIRECSEETGLTRLRVIGPVGTTDWYFRVGNALVHKYCDYFLLEADPGESAHPQYGEGIQACCWLSPSEAVQRITYANARQLLRRALERGEDISRLESARAALQRAERRGK